MRKIISIALLASFISMNVMPVFALENNNASTAAPKQFKSMIKKNKKNNDDYKFAYVNMNWWDNFNELRFKNGIFKCSGILPEC